MRFSVIDLFASRFDIPFTPGCDYRDIRKKSVNTELKSDLIVAFAGTTVANGVRALFFSDLRNTLRDYRTRKSGAEQIIFVLSARLYARKYVIGKEFLSQVFNLKF